MDVVPVLFSTPMTSRISEKKSNDDDGKAFVLRQYEDTDGHFSLVRRVISLVGL